MSLCYDLYNIYILHSIAAVSNGGSSRQGHGLSVCSFNWDPFCGKRCKSTWRYFMHCNLDGTRQKTQPQSKAGVVYKLRLAISLKQYHYIGLLKTGIITHQNSIDRFNQY